MALTDRERAIVRIYGERVPIGGRICGLLIGLFAFFAPGYTIYMIVKKIKENDEYFPL